MVIQLLKGEATLVEASTMKETLGVPSLPAKRRFVPASLVFAELGVVAAITSIEPSTSSRFVQLSPAGSDSLTSFALVKSTSLDY